MDETFSVVLSSHSTPPSRIGERREVNITVRENDDPYGVIEFGQSELAEAIDESKGDLCTRNEEQGPFRGKVSVSWFLDPGKFRGRRPHAGEFLVFREGEFLKNLTVTSLPDGIPEEMENFTLTLTNVTGGARLGSFLNATLQIPWSCGGGRRRGQLHRDQGGAAGLVATVTYRVEYDDASPTDLALLSEDTVLVYEVGEWMKNVSVAVEDDDVPETDEPFRLLLFNATGTSPGAPPPPRKLCVSV
ncbi:hypothetical protein CRUP_023148, partial [Coryphaenoides rupestris]